MEAEKLLKEIVNLAKEKKSKQIVTLNLIGLTAMTDYFVIITGDSDTHIKAICDNIEKGLKKKKVKLYHKEGYQSLRWVLLDYIDVIVHIFRGETREFYGLERLWADAKLELIVDE